MGSLNGNWLSQLAPAHAPPAVGAWPPAPGWWGVMLLLACTVALLLYFLTRRQARLRRHALREVHGLALSVNDDGRLAIALEHLLRRYAIAAYGREAVAGLSGQAWLDFLAAHGARELAGETGRAMLCVAYGGCAAFDRRHLLAAARAFIRSSP